MRHVNLKVKKKMRNGIFLANIFSLQIKFVVSTSARIKQKQRNKLPFDINQTKKVSFWFIERRQNKFAFLTLNN